MSYTESLKLGSTEEHPFFMPEIRSSVIRCGMVLLAREARACSSCSRVNAAPPKGIVIVLSSGPRCTCERSERCAPVRGRPRVLRSGLLHRLLDRQATNHRCGRLH